MVVLTMKLGVLHSAIIVKVWPYKYLIYISISWKFVREVSEEPNVIINFAKLLFYVRTVIKFFIKIQPNMFLNGNLGGWNIIEI